MSRIYWKTNISGSDDIVAVVAAETLSGRQRRTRAVAHDEERVEPERGVHHDLPRVSVDRTRSIPKTAHLALRGAEYGRQPSAFARVHKKEHDIVLVNELLESLDVLLRLLDGCRWDRMSGHRYTKVVSSGILMPVI